MSHLRYNSYPGFGEEVFESAHYSTAVRIPSGGETVQISGQGGWDRATSKMRTDLDEEINQAFDNVHHALLSEGGPGISSVYKLIVYLAPLAPETTQSTIKHLRKWFPNHRPLLTAIGVEKLAFQVFESGLHLTMVDLINAMAYYCKKFEDVDTVKECQILPVLSNPSIAYDSANYDGVTVSLARAFGVTDLGFQEIMRSRQSQHARFSVDQSFTETN